MSRIDIFPLIFQNDMVFYDHSGERLYTALFNAPRRYEAGSIIVFGRCVSISPLTGVQHYDQIVF